MLGDGIKEKGLEETLTAVDLAELVEQCLEKPQVEEKK
jgi:hypothetical protein